MKKSSKIIISIIIVLGIILLGIYYALIPRDRVNIVEGKFITSEELLTGSFIDYFEVLENPLRLEGKIAISDEEFKNVVYTVMTTYDIQELKNVYIDVSNNAIKVISPYKVLGLIDSQIEVNLNPSVVDNNLNIKLTDFKLGKIKISDKTVSEKLKSYEDKIPFIVKDGVIVVDKSYTYPMTLNDIKIKEKEIILDIQLEVNNFIDFISKYKIKIK
ncbi:DUF2140 domain-containing protein [Romboutsia sp.]|uniref:DUF2140 domain-containing protein n=1 Tax=Romboutsia sp. TaxID=1965302 RepID=UPI002BE6DB74|nr:DUF2140 domain-containing protein [Romboutsia sp.]HSQ87193.1 DUF2140 domain-containing protein [Romboutsia sp.]